MSRKLVFLFLTLAMVVTLFAGCSGNGSKDSSTGQEDTTKASSTPTPGKTEVAQPYGDTGGLALPIVTTPTTLSMMVITETKGNLNDLMIVKEIEKRTGITLDLQGYSTTTYKDKLNIILASGKLPDIILGLSLADANKMGGQGGLVAINKYADQLPNFKKLYMQENSWVMKSYTDDHNDLYTWPVYNVSRDVNHGFLYRKDIFEKNGIKEWTNDEEFYQALKKLKSIYPDSTPIVSKTKETIFTDWGYGWGLSGLSSPAYFDEKNKTWKLSTTQPEYKQMLDFMKKLYNEGLLDAEFLTDTTASWTAKMATDKAFVTFDFIGRLDMFYDQVKEQNPNYNLRYANPVGPTGNIRTVPKVSSSGVHVANNKNKEIALKLLDYLTSPSGGELVTIGVEGTTFTWDAKGKPVYPELKDVPTITTSVLSDRYGLWLQSMYLRGDSRSVYYNFTEKEQEAQDKMNAGKKYEPVDPILKLTDEETSTLAELKTSLSKSGNEFSAKYILTKEYGDKEWKSWLETAEKLGASRIEAIHNAAQKRFDSGS